MRRLWPCDGGGVLVCWEHLVRAEGAVKLLVPPANPTRTLDNPLWCQGAIRDDMLAPVLGLGAYISGNLTWPNWVHALVASQCLAVLQPLCPQLAAGVCCLVSEQHADSGGPGTSGCLSGKASAAERGSVRLLTECPPSWSEARLSRLSFPGLSIMGCLLSC